MSGHATMLDQITPRFYLRLEGGLLLVLATTLYANLPGGTGWLVFALGFFLPDIGMLGYLSGPSRGALIYNLFHTTAIPAGLLLLAWSLSIATLASVALIWLSHIGFDRIAGYGLKWPTAFGDTHLGLVGRGSIKADG